MNDSKLKSPSLKPPQFESADLYLCAFLRARGAPLVGIRRAGNKVFFAFGGNKDFERLVEEFFADGPAGILSVKNALRDLRALIRGDIHFSPTVGIAKED